MITEQQYSEAKEIVNAWLDAQPTDPNFPYKPKRMNIQDYMRQRALNEILRFFDSSDALTYEFFVEILHRFDLKIFINDEEGKSYKYVSRLLETPAFKDRIE